MEDMVDAWARQFGISPDQVKAAAGTVLTVVQSKLPPGDWQRVAAKIPQAVDWANDSPTISTAPVVPGAAAAMTGPGVLVEALAAHGIKPDRVADFVGGVVSTLRPMLGEQAVSAVRTDLLRGE